MASWGKRAEHRMISFVLGHVSVLSGSLWTWPLLASTGFSVPAPCSLFIHLNNLSSALAPSYQVLLKCQLLSFQQQVAFFQSTGGCVSRARWCVSLGFASSGRRQVTFPSQSISTYSKRNWTSGSDPEPWRLLAAFRAGSQSWGGFGGQRWQEVEHQLCLQNSLLGNFVIVGTCKVIYV